jgi:hypothetical protein
LLWLLSSCLGGTTPSISLWTPFSPAGLLSVLGSACQVKMTSLASCLNSVSLWKKRLVLPQQGKIFKHLQSASLGPSCPPWFDLGKTL